MIVNATRIMRRWIEHPEHGLAAQLEGVPRARTRPRLVLPDEQGDGAGDPMVDLLPPVPSIYDDIDDQSTAEQLDPPEVPALVLYLDSDARVDVDQMNYQVGESPLILAAAYITRDLPPHVASVYGGYTLRSLRRCLTSFNSQHKSDPYRELNGIKVMKVGLVTEQRVATAVGRSELWGFVLASITVVDKALA